ncbi:Chemotaxis protein CheA [Sporomusa ovata DSM 2662]|uniref:histidine kinase n=1 Tax=Sporomusa ovata TaxID=2378 RepID=A0A0U1L1N4_9FIRM|nr:chemotaxis protein CheW [Sporomusa ovata]EQB27230.1 chemotaxis protein CheA [Sporomusa ovata DSM 2662]CQR73073.1 Signal transduction histidine kinase CheA [Sporomusa ovata]
MELDSSLLDEFGLEAKAHIASIEAGLLRMEEGESDYETINGIFRAAHSIKGTASFFELNKIVELAHVMEDVFGEFRELQIEVSADMVDVLLVATDVLKGLINNLADSENYDTTDTVASIKNILNSLQQPPDQSSACSEKPSAWDLWNQLTSSNEQTVEVPVPTFQAPGNLLEVQPVASSGATVIAKQPGLGNRSEKFHEFIIEDSVRVNVGLLNDLLTLAGEMVLRRNQLLRVVQDQGKQVAQLEVVANDIDELTTQLQKKIMKTRMQPIANIFNKFPRIVRDLSRKVGKEVDLSLQGMNVELDRSFIEALADPITHLVRNALDHGIEAPEVREMNHKPVTGSLELRAHHENGRVIIDVCDDGAGIDCKKVKSKAVQNGVVSEKKIDEMCEAEVLNLIMTPGFSTADQVTDLSGRGVGMDVVKTNIEKLGGKIEIFSEIGIGTTVRLILPLTLAIISALLVVANKQTFAIPQANVRELLLIQPGESDEKRIEIVNKRPVLRLRGRLMPLVLLGEILTANSTPDSQKNYDYLCQNDAILRVLIVKSGNLVYGLAVDAVYDNEEILVKPLSLALGSCGLYSGMTVLGDGSIAMILDTESIRLRAGILVAEDTSLPVDVRETKTNDEDKQYLLLFQCSGGEMLGLDLAMVSRVEEVELSRLQKIGAKYYVTFQGQTTRVIRPEHYLPISKRKNKLVKVYVILPKRVKYSIGIIAENIQDTVFTKVSLDKDGVCGTGILGSALINDIVVTLVNMHELFVAAAPEYYNRLSDCQRISEGQHSDGANEARKITVLLVEDMPFFLKVVKSYLESAGYAVITAENGREALEQLLQSKIDAVVSDIEMPIMTGIELVRAIRADETLRHLPVIALTSLTGESNKEKGLRAGFDQYEYKLDRIRLLDSLRDVLQNRA